MGYVAMINRRFFFDRVRLSLFDGTLKARQITGLTAILDMFEPAHAANDDRWLAYMLATAHHETDRTMRPIDEYGSDAYFERRYGPPPAGQNPTLARRLGNTEQGDGARYHGRGFVQLTGRENYRTMGGRLTIDLEANPDRAKEPAVAASIMWIGMTEGLFTGRKLADYFATSREDWRGARRIINGVDKADLIANVAQRYYGAISHTI